MLTSKQLLVLVSAFLAETQALNAHRRAHQHAHALIKKDIIYAHTAYTTVTEMVTVTEYEGEGSTAAAKADYGENYAPAATSASPAEVVAPSPEAVAPPAEIPASAPPAPVETPTPNVQVAVPEVPVPTVPVDTGAGGVPAGGSKRGLGYNNGGLVNLFSGSKCSWSFNWGQTPDGAAPTDNEFVPMMWGPQHEKDWATNAEKMIAAGAKNFLGFNECDHDAQCNMSPADAAREHQRLLNPYHGRVRVSTPSITNSGDPNQGIGWLTQFLQACDGQCAYDFCAVHWYSPPDVKGFLDHMSAAHKACGKPIWINEFAPIGVDDATVDDFLSKVMLEMDTNPEYNFIERYAFFMVADGILTSGNSLSRYGKTYAFQ